MADHTRTPLNKCPSCGYQIDSATGAFKDGISPKPGDFSVCFNCAKVLAFNDDLTVRLLPLTEFMTLNETEQMTLIRVSNTIREFHKRGC